VKNVWSFLMLCLVLSIALGCSSSPAGNEAMPSSPEVTPSSHMTAAASPELAQTEAASAPAKETPLAVNQTVSASAAAPVKLTDAKTEVSEASSVSAQVYTEGNSGAAAIGAAAIPGSASSKQPRFRIPVMNYHSVNIDPGNVVVISPAKLEEQMQYLADNSYHVLTLQQFIDIWEGKAEAPPKSVLLTFDDGYTDNYTEAMPILKKFNFPATLFMTPGWVGQDGYLNWEQVEEMRSNGWDIQPHGMSHTSLPKLNKEEQLYEITEARKLIEEKFNTKANVFCYPYGHYNKTTLSILKEHEFLFGFTIEQGRADPTQSPYELRRLFVNGEEDLKMFANKLEKWK
jgi:peptidoglycan/xylan/chitin deacetylase (PgdA/CDA1 family)